MPKVNFEHAAYKGMLKKWRRCRDVASGTDAVKDSTVEYLPKAKDMEPGDYERYKLRAVFYNATWRTMAGLVGMMFRKPPKLEVAEGVKDMLEDVDGTGKPFQLFLQGVALEGLKMGRIGVLVDYPPADPNLSKADAAPMNLKPTMQAYLAESVINWQLTVVNNQSVPKLVVLREEAQVRSPDDEFVTVRQDRWRVLDLVWVEGAWRYRQRVFKEKTGEGGTATMDPNRAIEFEQVGGDMFPQWNAKYMDFIPFAVMGVEDVSFKVEDPPLIDLVDMNLSHFRTSAIYEQCVAFCPPTLFLAGFKKENPTDKIFVGSEEAIVSPDPAAKGSYIEYTGTALAALEKSLDRKEMQMAVLGARMLEPQKRGVEAAETVSIHRKGEESLLSSMAQAISLGMTKVLKWYMEWSGNKDDNALVELNRDFYPQPMTPQMLAALIAGWQQGAPGLSDQGLFELFQAGEIVSETTTLEEEQARIAERQQQMLADMKDQQDLLGTGPTDPAAGGGPPPSTPAAKKMAKKKPKSGAVSGNVVA